LGRLAGEFSLDNLDLAVSFAMERRAVDRWPEERWSFVKWGRDAEMYWAAMDHSSYMVRASAAEPLGSLFLGCMKNGVVDVTPLDELMEKIGSLERKTPGIAGAFLQGSEWSFGSWADFAGDFDMKRWMLDTLRHSKIERAVPGQQTLDFYAHELFQDDPHAIRAMLDMGRRNLAVLTATQYPNAIDAIRDVLDLMAQSDDPVVSRAIQTYLEERRHHAGCEFLPAPWFGQ
jgi:hypothetical protein